jgi:predicted site-specific integrase-resolvase
MEEYYTCEDITKITIKRIIIYVCVSSQVQKDDLERQKECYNIDTLNIY